MIPFTKTTGRPARKVGDRTLINLRPTYNAKNAELFKPVFQEMLNSGDNVFISAEAVGLRPSSLYVKAQDALRWLADNDEKFKLLRQRVSIARQSDGIFIYFKMSLPSLLATKSSPPSSQTTWRDNFETWLAAAQSGDMWDSLKELPEHHKFTPEDLAWVTKVVAPLDNIEAEITETRIRIMR